LLPIFDHSFPAFLKDLEQCGMLEETLVMCLSEHGRTPQLNNRPGGGREHWSRVYSVLLAGAGIAKGKIVGESDKIGGDVKSNPITPKDILASAFHLLGVDPHTTIPDPLGRPVPVAGAGVVRHELFD
jgi:arylsulfatase A-like enzyme